MAAVNLGTGVKPSSDTQTKIETAGEAVAIGQVVYREISSKKVKLANTSSSEKAAAIGVALTTATAADQPVIVAWSGTITGTATVVVGEPYFVSDTSGSVYPAADIGSADYLTFVGFGITATSFKLGILHSGVAHA